MADKKSTLVLIVDLDCCKCYKKIKRVLTKFPEIQNQSFDEKQKKVTISGPFDPETLKRKLCCKACKYIIDIQIPPEPKPAPAPAPAPAPPPPEPKPAPAPPPPEPKPAPAPPPPEPKPAPPPPKPAVPVPGIPIGPYGPLVGCRPCYECSGEHDSCRKAGPRVCCRECHEGREDGICRRADPGPGPRVCCRDCYEGREEDGICRRFGYQTTCHFFTEEDNSSCRIM